MFQFAEERLPAVIKVIGVGGGGSNAVSTMVQSDIKGVQFMVANTDMQALDRVHAPIKLQIGSKVTCGRGAGANPEIGRSAAIEDADKIKAAMAGAPTWSSSPRAWAAAPGPGRRRSSPGWPGRSERWPWAS